jgi:hypothetical protein
MSLFKIWQVLLIYGIWFEDKNTFWKGLYKEEKFTCPNKGLVFLNISEFECKILNGFFVFKNKFIMDNSPDIINTVMMDFIFDLVMNTSSGLEDPGLFQL